MEGCSGLPGLVCSAHPWRSGTRSSALGTGHSLDLLLWEGFPTSALLGGAAAPPGAAEFHRRLRGFGLVAPDSSGVNGDDPAVFVQGWREEINISPAPLHGESYGHD